MSEAPVLNKSFVILGGGTAGWMTAIYMQHKWKNKNFSISVIESPEIGIIGVGEGSTPSLRNFFDDVGIKETDWMPECNATYKLGIRFDGWSKVPGYTSYRHPFPSQIDGFTSPKFSKACDLRRSSYDVNANPDAFFLQSKLAEKKLGPISAKSFPFTNYYGYHFDSGLLGKYLAKIATTKGVKHIEGKVIDAVINSKGELEELQLEDGGNIKTDFVIDCSGFDGFLIQQKLNVEFKSFKENLFNDSAIVLPTKAETPFRTETISTALSSGWAWDIPLTNRTGNGYVFSSEYCSADQAEIELRKKTGLLNSDVSARHLKMKVGRVEKHWHKNCLAVGLSQGFIEPLEATALHLVQATILEFILNFEEGNFTNKNQDKFNKIINDRFDGVRDYIVAHYRLNSRDDSQYWRDNAQNNNVSESLTQLMHAWTGRISHDIDEEVMRQNIGQYFPVDSWRILFAGYGFFPMDKVKALDMDKERKYLSEVEPFLNSCMLNYGQ